MPDWSQEIRSRIAPLRLDPAREAEVVEELSSHLRDRREEMLAAGMTAQQTDETLLQELHDHALVAGLRTTVRRGESPTPIGREGNGQLLARTWSDLRHGVRLLVQNPAFSIVVILSLALGIGANTAIFQLLNAVRLRALPLQKPEELAAVHVDSPKCCRGDFYSNQADLTGGLWNQLRQQQQGFSDIAAWCPMRCNLSRRGEARYADTLMVSGNFFETLGVQPSLGRLLAPADDKRGCGSQGAVVSYGFWQREFGGTPQVPAKQINLNNHAFQIIGVTPANFSGLEVGRTFDVAIPLCAEAVLSPDGRSLMDRPVAWWITTIGRLKPGWTVDRASAQLAAISPGIFAATVPAEFDSEARREYLSFRLQAVSTANGVSTLRNDYAEPLWLLMALSGLVLLIACANLANLMLARASVRQREMALRLTLGASPARLVWQLLTESLLLTTLGAIAGALLAQVLSRVLVAFLSTQDQPLFLELTPDWRVLGFVTGLAGIACVLFGLTPALKASRTDPVTVLKASGRGLSAAGEHLLLRRVLVVSQVALSLVLLMGALLFARTFQNLMLVNAGFQQDNVLISQFDYSSLKLSKDNEMAFKRNLLARIQAIPGVNAAAEALLTPLNHSGWDDNIDIPGGQRRQDVLFNRVSPGYFRTMGTSLLAGRDFSESDSPGSPRKAIVNQTLVRKFFGTANPLGRTFNEAGEAAKTYEVIGIVQDTKYYSLREDPMPIVFVSFTQGNGPEQHSTLVIRSGEAVPSLISSVKAAAAEINPNMVLNFNVFKTQIREGLLRERLMATLSGFFGLLATALAMIGLYGVISYMVVRRRSEIGLRMALGATRARILGMVFREVSILLGIGLVIGAALALAGGKAADSLLYGLKPGDPFTLAAAIAGMAMVAFAASCLPAQRAASVDPMEALREE